MTSKPIAVAVLLAAACGAGIGMASCGAEPGSHDSSKAVAMSSAVTSLQIVDSKVGTGAEATPGRKVKVHYTGTLLDGYKFDSSRDGGQPLEFRLGNRDVIPGWDEGIKGMRVGGTRELTIPASMAYGAQGMPPLIPPNAALRFDVELVGVE